MATYWLNIASFSTLSYLAPLLPTFPLEFRSELNPKETKVMALYSSKDHMIGARVILTQHPRVTDGQMDG